MKTQASVPGIQLFCKQALYISLRVIGLSCMKDDQTDHGSIKI